MIQRKQSLWLLLSACVLALTFVLPYSVKILSGAGTDQVVYTPLLSHSHFGTLMATIGSALLSLVTIFLFKNRPLQLKLIGLNMVLSLLVLVLMVMSSLDKVEGNQFVLGMFGSQLYIALVLPLLSVIALYLAFHGVSSDEKLVKSADRMR